MASKGWRLVRAALVKIGKAGSPGIEHLELDAVEVIRTSNMSIKGMPTGAVCVASVPVEFNHDTDLAALLSGQVRREAEEALEFIARLSAIEVRTTHELLSPSPYIGLTIGNVEALENLDGQLVELKSGVLQIRPAVEASMKVLEVLQAGALAGRTSGVVLLAEALNCPSPLGRYSQLVRLFERAFGAGPGELTEPLVQFLAGTEHHFEADEVRQWMNARRHAIHADRSDEVYLDSDVRPIESRMLEAAYDVLLNKATWRNKSTERRNIWSASYGSRGANDEGIYIQQGHKMPLGAHALDGFMAYPLVREKVSFDQVLPRAAWLMKTGEGARLEVLGDWEAETSSEDGHSQ